MLSSRTIEQRGVGILRYEELDAVTRRWMMEELVAEEVGPHYIPMGLSDLGVQMFSVERMRAISKGDEDSFAKAMSEPRLWKGFQPSPKGGVMRTDPLRSAEALGRMEFNTLYVRGLSRRLMEEGELYCQVYLAGPKNDLDEECKIYENKVFRTNVLYGSYRAKYWPSINDKAFSIPSGPSCGHTIRRLDPDMKALIELEGQSMGASFRR